MGMSNYQGKSEDNNKFDNLGGGGRVERIREQIRGFPTGPGLYFMKDGNDVVLYIGKAKNLRSRAGSYFQPSSDLYVTRGPRIAEMIEQVEQVDYMETANEVEAVLQEARLIKDVRPAYNTDLVDDKTFPYLEVTTREQYPGVYITRNPKNRRSRLFGPFTSPKDLRKAVVLLQKIFKFRTCKLAIEETDDKRRFFRPCLLYSIKQCTAPCADKISRGDYRKLINDLVSFLNSKRSRVIGKLKREMADAAERRDYERAAVCRDRIRLIEKLDERGHVDTNVQPEVFAGEPGEALERLGKVIGAREPVRTIEGIDIAHISGSEMVGSLVKFIDARPFKAGYRRFRIKGFKGVDDYRAIAEVVRRRYKYAMAGEELWPELILIDGGVGQLNSAAGALAELGAPALKVASIAKRNEEVFVYPDNEAIHLKANDPARRLLQYVRDEAHRFAQHYHHILRRKKTLGE
jgi:excinuclease ABC subunit C